MMNKPRGRGRPRGPSQTREQILTVARRRFLEEGYEHVTMRAIAGEAGVDAALISYFFGSKRGLFGAALALAANPAELLASALPGEVSGLGERVLRTLLHAWDDPVTGPSLRAMAAAATSDPELARLLREVLGKELVGRIAERVGGADATARAGMFVTQISGVVFSRYVIGVEPAASMPADELIARLAPALRLVLTGGRPPRVARSA